MPKTKIAYKVVRKTLKGYLPVFVKCSIKAAKIGEGWSYNKFEARRAVPLDYPVGIHAYTKVLDACNAVTLAGVVGISNAVVVKVKLRAPICAGTEMDAWFRDAPVVVYESMTILEELKKGKEEEEEWLK